MRVVKPGWITHNDGNPIFSVDIHPDGSRCATGGQGDVYGKIIIWNMAPIRDESLEADDKVPKMLCEMDNHFACVNCVRWSHSGKFLASGGDDKLIMIWQTSRGAGPSKAFGSSGSVMIHEQWRPVFTLRGHTGDVLDLSWSPQDVWLATCSVDNTIIIWNALKFPEQITTLKGHSGLVKGVTWDPVGKYLASQSDDRTLRIWRTMDWQQEAVISEPFKECAGTTHSLRLNWSPDGHHIVSAHAMNNKGPTAQIIERKDFNASLDFVGHRKAITVVRFNPNIFSRKMKGNQQYSCCAIGSKDRSLSIWLTSLKRPLVVMHDLFDNSILDLTWSRDGLELMTCSLDGTVAYMNFTKEEIGHPLSQDEVMYLLEDMYGKGISLHAAATKGSQIIESAALLNLQQQQKNKGNDSDHLALTPSKNSNLSTQMSAGGDNAPFKPTDKQIETRTADGRRRITPIFLAPQPEFGEVPLPFSTNSSIEFHSSSEKSKIIVERQNRVTAPGMLSPSSGSKSMSSPPHTIPSQSAAVKDIFGTKEGQIPKAANETVPEKAANKSSQGPLPESGTAIPSLTEKSQDKSLHTPTVEKPKAAEKEKEKDKDKEKDSAKDSAAAKEKLKSRLTSGNVNLKRKYGDDKRYAKRGRPSKTEQAAREAEMAAAAAEAVGSISRSDITATPAAGGAAGAAVNTQHRETRVISSIPDLQLPAMSIEKSVSKEIQGQMGDANSLVLEVENNLELGAIKVNRLRLMRGAKVMWNHMLTSKISGVAGSNHVLCAACIDGTVSLFSIGGKRLLPALATGAPPAFVSCKGHYVLVVTTKGMLFVWNCQSLKAEIRQESLTAIMSDKDKIDQVMITTEGVPVVTLANKNSYSFSLEIGCWILVGSEEDRLQSLSNHHQCAPCKLRPQGTLSSIQKQSRSSEQASRSFQSNPGAQQSMTLSFLESQIALSLALKSASEYKFWVETYIRYLAQEGLEEKLREMCDELLGPLYRSRNSKSWNQHVLGIDKHKILRNTLPSIGADLRFQRLYTEYNDQLDMMQGTG